MKIRGIALNTFREAIRNRVLYSVLLFAVILVGISAFFGSVSIGSQVKVIKDFGLFSLSFFGAIISIISGVSLLNKELKQKTVYNILSKPVARWEFILGKYLGLTLTVSVLISLMGTALVLFVMLFEQRIDWQLFGGVAFVILEASLVCAVAMFFSSLVVTTTLTGIFTLATYIAGRSIHYLQFFLEGREAYNRTLTGLVRICNWVLPDLSIFNLSDQIVYGDPVSFRYFITAIVYCVAYSAAALLFATLIFNRRELT